MNWGTLVHISGVIWTGLFYNSGPSMGKLFLTAQEPAYYFPRWTPLAP